MNGARRLPHTRPQLMEPSRRELEVLALVAEGLFDKEIAQRLYIAHGTVRDHLQSVYLKLSVRNRVEAVLWWLRQQEG